MGSTGGLRCRGPCWGLRPGRSFACAHRRGRLVGLSRCGTRVLHRCRRRSGNGTRERLTVAEANQYRDHGHQRENTRSPSPGPACFRSAGEQQTRRPRTTRVLHMDGSRHTTSIHRDASPKTLALHTERTERIVQRASGSGQETEQPHLMSRTVNRISTRSGSPTRPMPQPVTSRYGERWLPCHKAFATPGLPWRTQEEDRHQPPTHTPSRRRRYRGSRGRHCHHRDSFQLATNRIAGGLY
jgi:hypothetical protein